MTGAEQRFPFYHQSFNYRPIALEEIEIAKIHQSAPADLLEDPILWLAGSLNSVKP